MRIVEEFGPVRVVEDVGAWQYILFCREKEIDRANVEDVPRNGWSVFGRHINALRWWIDREQG